MFNMADKLPGFPTKPIYRLSIVQLILSCSILILGLVYGALTYGVLERGSGIEVWGPLFFFIGVGTGVAAMKYRTKKHIIVHVTCLFIIALLAVALVIQAVVICHTLPHTCDVYIPICLLGLTEIVIVIIALLWCCRVLCCKYTPKDNSQSQDPPPFRHKAVFGLGIAHILISTSLLIVSIVFADTTHGSWFQLSGATEIWVPIIGIMAGLTAITAALFRETKHVLLHMLLSVLSGLMATVLISIWAALCFEYPFTYWTIPMFSLSSIELILSIASSVLCWRSSLEQDETDSKWKPQTSNSASTVPSSEPREVITSDKPVGIFRVGHTINILSLDHP